MSHVRHPRVSIRVGNPLYGPGRQAGGGPQDHPGGDVRGAGARAERAVTFHLGEQFSQAHAQGTRYLVEVDHSDVALAI